MSDSLSSPLEFEPVEIPSIRYFHAFEFIFENPKWLTNVLLVAVCQFIPIAGPIVILGYQFELAQSLLYETEEGGYVDFSFDNFVQYLLRGLWPFLVSIVVFVVLFIPMVALFVGSLVVAGALADQRNEVAVGVMATGYIALMALWMIVNLYLLPMTLRAGYSQDFLQAFDIGFANRFIALMWKEIILEALFQTICGMVLMIAGFLCCFIGVYFTMAIFMMGQAHLFYFQLYSAYLARGGDEIPVKQLLTAEDTTE